MCRGPYAESIEIRKIPLALWYHLHITCGRESNEPLAQQILGNHTNLKIPRLPLYMVTEVDHCTVVLCWWAP